MNPEIETEMDEEAEDYRQFGTVKRFDSQRGFGFITPMLGSDLFFHLSAVIQADRFRMPREGDAVEYEIGEGRKGLQAVDVVLL